MTPDLELRYLRALVAVAREGGVGRAARALGLSQSTVSEQLLALERSLDIKLTVRRKGQELTLSQAGEAWLPHAVRILREVEAAVQAAGGRKLRAFRIGATESLGSFVLPAVLSALQAQWAGLEAQVSNGLCDELRAGVRADVFDLALTLNAPDARGRSVSGLQVTRLALAPLAILARPDDPLAARPAASRRDLADRVFLEPDPDGELHRCLVAYLHGVSGSRLQSAGTISGVKAGVLAGQGLGVLPAYAAATELKLGGLREIVLSDPLPAMSIEAAVLDKVTPPPPLGDLLRLLAAELVDAGVPALTLEAAPRP